MATAGQPAEVQFRCSKTRFSLSLMTCQDHKRSSGSAGSGAQALREQTRRSVRPLFLSKKLTNSSSTSRRLFIILLSFTSLTQIITYANHLIMTSGFKKWIIYRNLDNIYLFSARTLQHHRNAVQKGTLKGQSRPPALKEIMVEIMCIIM